MDLFECANAPDIFKHIFNALTKELENETLTDNLIGVNDSFSEMYLSRKFPELGIISYEVV